MGASRFSDLQASVEESIAKLKDCIGLLQGATKDAARKINADATKYEADANRDLRAMEAEARDSVPSVRRTQQDAVASLRKEIGDAKIRLQKVNEAAQRAELMSDRTAEDTALLAARDKMVSTTSTAMRGTTKLQQANAMLAETQDIGVNVLDTLQQQRGQIVRSTERASDTNTLTYTARSIMQGMQRRAVTNKFLLIGAIVILLALIVVVVVEGYIKHPKGK